MNPVIPTEADSFVGCVGKLIWLRAKSKKVGFTGIASNSSGKGTSGAGCVVSFRKITFSGTNSPGDPING